MLAYTAAEVVPALEAARVVVVDTETSSLYPWRDGKILAGLGVRPLGGPGYYLPVRHETDDRQAGPREVAAICAALRGRSLVFHNAKFDLAVLWQEGIDLTGEDVVDTVVLARLVYPDLIDLRLKSLAKQLVDPDAGVADARRRTLMTRLGYRRYSQLAPWQIHDYVCADGQRADPNDEASPRLMGDLYLTERLVEHLLPRVRDMGLLPLLWLEQRTTRTLFDMERHGIVVDRDYARAQLAAVSAQYERLDRDTYDRLRAPLEAVRARVGAKPVAGRNPQTAGERQWLESGGIPVHTNALLARIFNELGVRSGSTTPKRGSERWDRDELRRVADDPAAPAEARELARAVIDLRHLDKYRSYYAAFLELADPSGVLHCSINQAGPRTGRMSSSAPNLQNIPRVDGPARPAGEGRGDDLEVALASRVRGAFVPRPGRFLLMADWAQIELRIFADYARERDLLAAFELGLDVHRLVALAALGELPPEGTPEFDRARALGKQLGFGLLYGMGAAALAAAVGCGQDRAREFIRRYFDRFGRVRALIDATQRRVYDTAQYDREGRGVLRNRYGRRRYIPTRPRDLAYVGVNFLVQGTAADLMKDAMTRIDRRLRAEGLATLPLLPIHDELILDVPYAEARRAVAVVTEEMGRPGGSGLTVPLRVDLGWAPERWSEKRVVRCGPCGGIGRVFERGHNELVRALYDGEDPATFAFEMCAACGGSGRDLAELLDLCGRRAG